MQDKVEDHETEELLSLQQNEESSDNIKNKPENADTGTKKDDNDVTLDTDENENKDEVQKSKVSNIYFITLVLVRVK